jgi:hypothetical protein
MTVVSDYLDDTEAAFLLSSVVLSFQVREREERQQEGFIRLRAVLATGDVFEAFEFVVVASGMVQTLTYQIHWQDGAGRLKRRWDNAPHHRDVSMSPHHVHAGPGDQIEPSEPITILRALAHVDEAFQGGRR